MADTFHHEPPYTIGVICGSIAASSINRRLANALVKLAPEDLQCSFIEIDTLDLYDHDRDGDYPPEAVQLKQAIKAADGILIEPGAVHFAGDSPPKNFFRLGFSSIPVERIEPGIRRLAEIMRRQLAGA